MKYKEGDKVWYLDNQGDLKRGYITELQYENYDPERTYEVLAEDGNYSWIEENNILYRCDDSDED